MEEQTNWAEKYRPKTFDDVYGQERIISNVKAMTEEKNMPHLLFIGQAGLGKTTTAFIIAKTLFKEDTKYNFLDLNASDERGIGVVRGKIKDFASTKSISNYPFKIILLDECDSLTKDAQNSLRRIMEDYANNVKFILSCNYNKIIPAIKSRCSIFQFEPISDENLKKIVDKVAIGEKFEITEKAKEQLVKKSYGDARKLINLIQSIAVHNKKIDEELISKLYDEMEEAEELLDYIIKEDTNAVRRKLYKYRKIQGIPSMEILRNFHNAIWKSNLLEPIQKVMFTERLANAEVNLMLGCNEYIQLDGLFCSMILISRKIKQGEK